MPQKPQRFWLRATHCSRQCDYGARLQVWLTQPLVDLEAITARHDIVEAFVTDLDLRERLRDQSLRGGVLQDPCSFAHHDPVSSAINLLSCRYALRPVSGSP